MERGRVMADGPIAELSDELVQQYLTV
jgi:hypothetical protein